MITTTLSSEDGQRAIKAGTARQQRRVIAGVERDSYSFCDNVTGGHIDGVRGEIVLSKVLGIPWIETPYTKDEADLADFIESRLRNKHWYELFIHPKDKDDRLYFLITKEKNDPLYRVHGFVYGWEAKQQKYWKQITQNPPSFFVPQEHLHPVEELLETLAT